jgi:hypothetical protein
MSLDEAAPFDFKSRAWDYFVRTSSKLGIIGNPAAVDDPSYLAHLANDSTVCTGPGTSTTLYAIKSSLGANVGLHGSSLYGCAVAMIALCPVDEGSELLLSYGASYWMSRSSNPPRSHHFPDGGGKYSKYTGEVDAGGVSEGEGEHVDGEGNRYVGAFKGGRYHGPGTYHFIQGGAVEVSAYKQGRDVGTGARWNADRSTAWRIVAPWNTVNVGGSQAPPLQPAVRISLEEAANIALELGLPVPPPVPLDCTDTVSSSSSPSSAYSLSSTTSFSQQVRRHRLRAKVEDSIYEGDALPGFCSNDLVLK